MTEKRRVLQLHSSQANTDQRRFQKIVIQPYKSQENYEIQND